MEINAGNIRALTTDINTTFNKYILAAPSLYKRFSQTVPSSSAENYYPRVDEIGELREWVGQREIERIEANGFRLANRTFEKTIGIKREDLEDDEFGVLKPAIDQISYNASLHPDKLVFDSLMAGARTICMDGQNFFDTDHVTHTEDGSETSYSNIAVPQGTEAAVAPWYLFVTVQPLKPMIFQTRRQFAITAKTNLSDGNVFNGNEFLWGVDGRCAAGVGMWQMAYRSTRPLTSDNLNAAWTAMSTLRRKDGSPYSLTPDLLVVPTTLRMTANEVIKGTMVPILAPDGKTWLPGSNPVQDLVDVLVAPRLSSVAGG